RRARAGLAGFPRGGWLAGVPRPGLRRSRLTGWLTAMPGSVAEGIRGRGRAKHAPVRDLPIGYRREPSGGGDLDHGPRRRARSRRPKPDRDLRDIKTA